MKRHKKVRHIKRGAGNFDEPGDFPMFKPIEISSVDKVPGSFAADVPLGGQSLVRV